MNKVQNFLNLNRHFVLCLMLLLLICLSGNAQVQVHPLANQTFDLDEIPSIGEHTPLDEHIAYLTSPYYSLARETLAARYAAASPQERRHIADVFLETYDTIPKSADLGNSLIIFEFCKSIGCIFYDTETANTVAEYIAQDIYILWEAAHADFWNNDTVVYMRRIGALGDIGLDYLLKMPWQSQDGVKTLGQIGTKRAKDQLILYYDTQEYEPFFPSDTMKKVNILKALSQIYSKNNDHELLIFLRENLTEYLIHDDILIRQNALLCLSNTRDSVMLPQVEALRNNLPHLRDTAIHITQKQSLRVYENILDRVWTLLGGRAQKAELRANRIRDIEESLRQFVEIAQKATPPPSAERIFITKAMHNMEIALLKRDYPASSYVYLMIHLQRTPEDAWSDYATWTTEMRRDVLLAVQEIMEDIHADIPDGVIIDTNAMDRRLEIWLNNIT